MKKFVYRPLAFFNGSYKFTKVKSSPDFVRELESFYFGGKSFCRNDSWDKVLKYYAFVGVYFEYSHYFNKDEEIYRNACNMNSLNKRFRKKIMTMTGK